MAMANSEAGNLTPRQIAGTHENERADMELRCIRHRDRVRALLSGGVPVSFHRGAKPLLIFLWFLESLAYAGLIFFLLSKKTPTYLPSKKIIYLSLGIILSLQLAIRFYDWRTFDITKQILIGTPGRYFLPTILPHFVILVTGFGFLFTKNRAQFTLLLKTLSLGMLLLSMYAVFNVIIPRYYL